MAITAAMVKELIGCIMPDRNWDFQADWNSTSLV